MEAYTQLPSLLHAIEYQFEGIPLGDVIVHLLPAFVE
jgi:hypothetical protein